MDRVSKKLHSTEKALASLLEVLALKNPNSFERDGQFSDSTSHLKSFGKQQRKCCSR